MRRGGRATTIGGVSTLLALAGLSPPASAADPIHAVTVSKDHSIVLVEGLTEGDPVLVEVRRNGIQIGTATGVAPVGGVFELNHKVETLDEEAPEVAVCWTGSTPDILGGDVVKVTAAGQTDEIVVTDLDVIQEPVKVDANTGIVRGRVGNPVPPISELVVRTSGETATGARYDGEADSATGTLRYTSPGRFKATFDGLTRAQMGAFLDSEDVTAEHLSAQSLTGSHTTVATYGADAQFTEDLCPPVARYGVTGTSKGAINRSNVDGRLTVRGVSADAEVVTVKITDRKGNQLSRPATTTSGGTYLTWATTYPAGSLRGLADGNLVICAEYTEDAGVLTGFERSIRKDTSAPAGPRIRPGGGTFLRSETVRLRSPGAHEIWYTLNGTRPRPNRGAEYHGEFRLTSSAILRAIAYDRAGNSSPVTTARFRRAGTPAAPRIGRASSGVPGGRSTATVRWRPRANTGGTAISGFAVTALRMVDGRIVGSRTFQRPARARWFRVQLRPGHYRFQVRSLNRVGRSAPSALSNRVTAR